METGYKFSIRREDGVTIEISSNDEDLGYDDLINVFTEFSLAVGYGQSTIDQYITKPQPSKSSDQ